MYLPASVLLLALPLVLGATTTAVPAKAGAAPARAGAAPAKAKAAPAPAVSKLRFSEDVTPDPAEICECVPYYQCDGNKRILTGGEGQLDVRFRACENPVDVCCLPPLDEDETSPETPYQPSEQPPYQPSEQPPYQPPEEPPYQPPEQPPYQPPEQPPYGSTETPPYQPPVEPSPYPSTGLDPHIIAPSRPPGKGCGLKRIAQWHESNDYRITSETGVPETTGFGEYPWMVAIFRKEHDANKFICGGSLIEPNVVLTGAHCLSSAEVGELKVRAGDWDTQHKNEPIPHQDRGVSRLIPHAEFNTQSLANDVALIVLDRPFDITDTVDTVCVPPQKGAKLDFNKCVATGWGKNEFGQEGKFQTIMKKVTLPIVNRHDCQEILRGTRLGKHFRLHPSFVCAGGHPGEDTCYGDGGGPLVCPKLENPHVYAQVGIVAWGIGCGDKVPGVYSSVEHFSSWIEHHLSNL